MISGSAETVEAARDMFAQDTWDVLLADCTTPEWQAHGVASFFRKRGLFTFLPLIAITRTRSQAAAAAAERVDAFAYTSADDGHHVLFIVARLLSAARQQAEFARLNQMLHVLTRQSDQGILVVGRDGRIHFVNEALPRMFGYTLDELTSMDAARLLSLIHTQDVEMVVTHCLSLAEGREGPQHLEIRANHRDGSPRWLGILVTEVEWDGERVFQATTVDITERVTAQQALRTNDQVLRLALEAANAGVWEWSMKDDHAYWSAENYRVLGYEPGSVASEYANWLRAVHPDDRAAADAEVQRCIRERCALNKEFRVVWPDGSVHWLQNIGRLQFDRAGATTGMIGIQIDVTARKQAEVEKREADETLRALLSSFPAEITVHDLNGRISSHVVQPEFGSAPDRFGGRQLAKMLTAAEMDRLGEYVRQVAATGKPFSAEDAVNGQGETFYLQHELYPIQDAVGQVIGVGRITRDVTDSHNIEEVLERNLRELAAMYAITSALNESLQPEVWCHTLFDILAKFLHTDAAWIVLENGRDDDLSLAIGSKGSGESVIGAGLAAHLAGCEVCGPPKEPVGVSHVFEPCARVRGEHLEPFGIVSAAAVHLCSREGYLGQLSLGWAQPYTLSHAEHTTLDAIAQQVALAVHNARLYRRARQTSHLHILNALNEAIMTTLDPTARVEIILDHAALALDASVAAITFTEPMSGIFPTRVCQREKGWIESPYVEGVLQEGADFLAALSARHEAAVASMDEMPSLAAHPQADIFRDSPTLLAPVVSEGELLAVLMLARSPGSPPFADESHDLAIAIADVTASAIRNAHLFVTEQSQRQSAEALLSVSSLLTSTLDSNSLLQGILDSVSRVLPYDVCSIMRFEGDTARVIGIQVGPQHSIEGVSALAGLSLDGAYALRLPIPSVPGLAELVQARSPVILPDMNRTPDQLTYPWMMWVRSAASIPILVGGQLIGCLSLVSSTPRTYSRQQVTTMTTFAAQVGAALYNAQLFEESETRARRLAVMASVTAAAITSLDLEAVLNRVLETTCHAFGADLATLIIQDGRPQALTITFERAAGEASSQEAPSQPAGLLGYALEQNRALRIDDLSLDPRFDPAVDVNGMPGMAALICAPLSFHDTFSGVFALVRGAERPFSEGELHLLQSLAPMVALATANARLYRASRSQAEEMALVNEFGLHFARSLDSRALTRDMRATLKAYLQADILVLFDHDAARDLLIAWTDPDDPDPDYDRLQVPVGASISGWALRNRQAVLVDDVQSDPRTAKSLGVGRADAQHSLMAVPFFDTSGSSGVVVATAERIGAFSARELSLFQSLVSFLAVMLENARLYEQTKRLFGEREQAQTLLVQNEKMAALGRLTASVAHEINNPIQAILGFISLAQEELEGNGDVETLARYLGIVEDEIDRIAVTVERMREFYRPDRSLVNKTDIHILLRFVLELTAKKLQESNVRVERSWTADLPGIPANPDQLKQVFLNLVLNAIDAMPEGGVLRISTSLAPLARQADGAEPDAAPGLRIEFRDTGAGIPDDVLPQIFEPFFTTKHHGSGLGLSISYGIVVAHRGYITATSKIGEGTSFVVHFPVG
ncbi:MAG: GAF domain-containing protein [Anaerolineae bacterium]|nr:GAF domain-containing protein [Anaerolineae bacterium]